ncbi:hypothetical protein DFJ74DRAFT_633249 [Hyaloraphidium curvatum]|nr:hypothetical protein DFJ74DRAFT_633249 [Hyaloraphidium curvatum]
MDAPREGTFLARFPRYDETVAYLRGLAAGLPAGVNGSLESIGESVEGRDIWVFRLTGAAGRAEEKKQIWINGLLHAREWITLTTALYILSSLINSHSTAPELLDRFEWLFCPLANPDGYEYTQTTDRFWRKNRSGPGVDLNRNFPYQWGREPGSSGNPNAGSYRGPAPLSEPESAAVHKYVMGLTRRSAMVDLHSYGQLVLRSWGFGNAVPPEDGEIAALSASIVGRIRAATGAEYAAIRSAQLYPASGTMADWAAAAGMLAFTAELRSDAGGRGFVLPPEDIVPVGRDGWAMVQELAGFLLSAEGRGFVWGAEGVPSDGGYVLDGRAVTGGLPEGWRPTVPVLPPIYDPAPGTTATATTTTAVVRTTSLRLKSTKRGRTTSRRKKTTSRRRKTTTRRKTTKRRTSTRRRARW